MTFVEGIKQESDFYYNILRPFLESKNKGSVFMHYGCSVNDMPSKFVSVFESMQKKCDIDVIVDDHNCNFTLSLKVTTYSFNTIFFETVSNTNKQTVGWGYKSEADFIVYAIPHPEVWELLVFRPMAVRCLDLSKYEVKYSSTWIGGMLAYRTKGLIIPKEDFQHAVYYVER